MYPLHLPVAGGGKLTIKMGHNGFKCVAACIVAMLRDDPETFREVCEMADNIIDEVT
jgi:hypothetical protein